jgi:hypothetical protein
MILEACNTDFERPRGGALRSFMLCEYAIGKLRRSLGCWAFTAKLVGHACCCWIGKGSSEFRRAHVASLCSYFPSSDRFHAPAALTRYRISRCRDFGCSLASNRKQLASASKPFIFAYPIYPLPQTKAQDGSSSTVRPNQRTD